MRVLIFGATGGTGRQLVFQALRRGYDVSAFARNPGRLAIVDPRLRVVQGDVQRAESIRAAISGHDAVLSALGTRSLGPTTLLSNAAGDIVAAMSGRACPCATEPNWRNGHEENIRGRLPLRRRPLRSRH